MECSSEAVALRRLRPPVPISILAGLVLLPHALWAQARADNRAARTDSIFAEWDAVPSPGCVVGVREQGALVYARGHGMASLEHRVPLDTGTVLDIGSVSKQFTATAVVLLSYEGKLSLDDTVRRWIPELPATLPRITVRQLLHHTSGLRDYVDLLIFSGHAEEDWTTPQQALDLLAKQKTLNFAPGTEWRYSNSGYFLLGLIVERASGKSLRALMAERIFGPLGMTHTFVLDKHNELVPRKASSYAPRSGGAFSVAMSNWEQVGDGAVQSTLTDLARWDEALERGTLGGPGLSALLATAGTLTSGESHGYGFGVGVDVWRGVARQEHSGAWAGFRAQLMRFPAQRTSVLLLCNRADAGTARLAERMAEVWLGSALQPVPQVVAGTSSARAADIARDTGLYVNEHVGSLRYIGRARDGITLATMPGSPNAQPVFYLGDGRYVVSSGLTFSLDRTRQTMSFLPSPRTTMPIVLARATAPPLSGVAVDPFAGTYRSDDVDASVIIEVQNGSLIIKRDGWPGESLVPLSGDLFTFGGALVRFGRDGRGTLTDLQITTRGVVALRFRLLPISAQSSPS